MEATQPAAPSGRPQRNRGLQIYDETLLLELQLEATYGWTDAKARTQSSKPSVAQNGGERPAKRQRPEPSPSVSGQRRAQQQGPAYDGQHMETARAVRSKQERNRPILLFYIGRRFRCPGLAWGRGAYSLSMLLPPSPLSQRVLQIVQNIATVDLAILLNRLPSPLFSSAVRFGAG
jgi:hypothetical protein